MIYGPIIVGGGIGGSSLGAVMARFGCRVLVLEQSTVYEDQVRGERYMVPGHVHLVR